MWHFGLLGQGIISGLTALNTGADTAVTGIRSIFFNHNSLTTAAYFTQNGLNLGLPSDGIWRADSVMYKIAEKVTQYYYILRNLAIAALLMVLLYIAIRMALSTVSADEAKYKKMLTNWAVSLALVFVLHYIMIITFYVNNTIVSILDKTMPTDSTWDYGGALIGEALIPFSGFGEAIIFLMLIGMELTFLFMYIKRIIVLGFLILIAPLITITYSIDKIGDGKSQALNTWLKEFIYNVIIQPFHCILYITMVKTVIDAMQDKEGVGGFIIYIIVLQFVKEAEEIIKKIFNIQAGSMPGIKGMGTLAVGAMTAFGKVGKAGKAAGGAAGKAKKMPKMTTEAGKETAKKTPTNVAEKGAETKPSGPQRPVASGPQRPTKSKKEESSAPFPITDFFAETNAENPSEGESSATSSTSGTTPPNDPNAVNKVDSGAKKIKEFTSDAVKGFNGAMRYAVGQDKGFKDVIKKAAKTSASVAAAGIGLGMGDLNSAIGMGMAVGGIGDKIDDAILEHKQNIQLEDNEDVYDQKYAEYVQEYSRITGITNEDEIRNDLVGLFEAYDNGSLNYKSIKNEDERELKRKFLQESYDKLRESYEAAGGEKPTDLVKAHTNNKSSVKYKEMYGA